eukprot:7677531-Alexandrium_andersonii.AAC.1
MSASLVGSEMCIRDSASALLLGPRARRRPGRAGHRPREVVLALRRRRSVSYTHLTLPTICSV